MTVFSTSSVAKVNTRKSGIVFHIECSKSQHSQFFHYLVPKWLNYIWVYEFVGAAKVNTNSIYDTESTLAAWTSAAKVNARVLYEYKKDIKDWE